MTASRRRPTLRDVAREAGISVTQTSRALGHHDDVAEATRALVNEAADRLGYAPNLQARRLVQGSTETDTIGLIVPRAELEFSDASFAELLSGIVEVASDSGRELRLTAGPGGPDDAEPYRRAVRGRSVDGFILVRTEVHDLRSEALVDLSFPFVTLGRPSDQGTAPYVDDIERVMRPVVDHIVGLGHQRIGCIVEPQRYALAQRRSASLMASLAAHELGPPAEMVVEAGYDWRAGYEAGRQLLATGTRPTAIVALNDVLALGAIAAVRDEGLRTPEDVSVTGFDDTSAAAFSRPGLTTLHRDAREVGGILCQQLVDLLEGTTTVGKAVLLEPSLVVRGSTGAPPNG